MDLPSIVEQAERPYVSTGHLPEAETVQQLVSDAHRRFKSNTDGQTSQVYPALARVPSDLFGVCVVGTSGSVYAAGDSEHEFSIMSVSKPRVRVGLRSDRPGRGARQARSKRHWTGFQFPRGHRARRWPDQPDGECRQ
jgi:glutaminase